MQWLHFSVAKVHSFQPCAMSFASFVLCSQRNKENRGRQGCLRSRPREVASKQVFDFPTVACYVICLPISFENFAMSPYATYHLYIHYIHSVVPCRLPV